MYTVKLRTVALLMALLTVLCLLLAGCGAESSQTADKPNDLADATKENSQTTLSENDKKPGGTTIIVDGSEPPEGGDGSAIPKDDSESSEPAPGIWVNIAAVTVQEGSTFDLLSRLDFSDAEEIAFASSDLKTFTVDQTGMITAHEEGTAYVTVTATSQSGVSTKKYVDVTVTDADTPIPDVVLFEERVVLDAEKLYSLPDVLFSLAEKLCYESDCPQVATVSESGVIRAVAKGSATIKISVELDGKVYEKAEFFVTVREPWLPKDPISREAVTAMTSLPKHESFTWFNVSVCQYDQYNVRGLETCTAGPAEIWINTLQMLFIFERDEIDATIGIEDPGTYDYYFDFYYRPYDETNDRGDYKKATLQPWSIYNDISTPIYRCTFYDAFGFAEGEGLTEDCLYQVIFVVRRGSEQLGYFETEFTWTDSCATFVEAAENDPTIIR